MLHHRPLVLLSLAATALLMVVPLLPSHAGGDACRRADFDTKLIASSCTQGGQSAAKDAMKKWVKEAKAKKPGLECASCHSKMAPDYPLKANGLELYRQLGGE